MNNEGLASSIFRKVMLSVTKCLAWVLYFVLLFSGTSCLISQNYMADTILEVNTNNDRNQDCGKIEMSGKDNLTINQGRRAGIETISLNTTGEDKSERSVSQGVDEMLIKVLETKNIAPNPGFQEGDPVDSERPLSWKPLIRDGIGKTTRSIMRYEEEGYIDKGCVSIYTPTNRDWGEWESIPIYVKPNTAYELTFWHKANGMGAVEIIFDGTDRYIYENPEKWSRISELFVTRPTTTKTTIRLVVYHRSGKTAWFDHICLYPVNNLAVNLLEPKNNATVADNSPTFSWEAPLSCESFTLEYSPDSGFDSDKTIVVSDIKTSTFTPTETLANGDWYWRIKPNAQVRAGIRHNIPELQASTTGKFTIRAIKGEDTTNPLILSFSPMHRRKTGPSPTISALYHDNLEGLGVDLQQVQLTIDGKDVSSQASISDTGITYLPDKSLEPGQHVVTLTIKDKAGNSAEKEWIFYSYRKEPTVRIGEDNILYIDRKPFFPIGIYSYRHREKLSELANAGFNTIWASTALDPYTKESKKYLDEIYKHNMKLLTHFASDAVKGNNITEIRDRLRHKGQLAWRNHPSVIGDVSDECESGEDTSEKMLQVAEILRINSPLPYIACISIGKDTFLEYEQTYDILMPDPYPIHDDNPAYSRPFPYVSETIRSAREAVSDKKPVWAVVQAFSYVVAKTGSVKQGEAYRPTPLEQRCLTYLPIVHGAKGVIFWASDSGKCDIVQWPKNWQALKKIASELKILAPALLSQVPQNKVSVVGSANIHFLLSGYEDKLYLIAVNPHKETARVTFTISHFRGEHKVELLFEDRILKAIDGSFSDTFTEYAVHIYMIKLK